RFNRLRGLGRGLFLQLGEILVLQFDEFLQLGNVFLKTGQTIIGVLERFFLRNQVFFATLGGGARLATRSLRLGNLDLILRFGGGSRFVLDLGGDLAGRFLLAGFFLGRSLCRGAGQLAAIGI